MVTKEQCLLNKVLENLKYNYGGDNELIDNILSIYNQGKNYGSEMIFRNNENGLDQALRGFSPSFIVYSILSEDSEFSLRDPFFMVSDGLRSLDGFDVIRMISDEDKQKLLNPELFEGLSNTEISEAFDDFVHENYPQIYENVDTDVLYDLGYRTAYSILNADWGKLVQELQQYNPDDELNESKTIKLTERDLKKLTNKILKEIMKK